MNKHKWEHLVTRRLAVQVAIAWNSGFGRYFKARYGAGINNTLVYFDGKKTDYFVDQKEHKQFNEELDNLLENPEFVFGVIPEGKEFVEEQYTLIKNRIKCVNQLSNADLAELYGKVSDYHANYYTRMWMVFRICERIVMKIEKMIAKSNKDSNDVKEQLRIFTTPLAPNDVTEERIDLLKIALTSNVFNRKTLLSRHTLRFKHIPMYDFDHIPYTLNHFNNEFNGLKHSGCELDKILRSYKKRKVEFDNCLKEHQKNKELVDLILMLKKAVFLRDYRDKIRQKLNLSLRNFYAVIGERIGLNVEETALLTNQEIYAHLKSSSKFDKNEILRRQKGFLLIQSEDDIKIYSEKEAQDHAKNINLYVKKDIPAELKGIIASKGKARGRARIIYTNRDLSKIEEGDIMVATMTRQDYVPYMRKSNAIVTNEGGITCHAAIIARELSVPCLVGVSNATSFICDGDLIEVDAENGFIRKIS